MVRDGIERLIAVMRTPDARASTQCDGRLARAALVTAANP
jgi:hypothetical protein